MVEVISLEHDTDWLETSSSPSTSSSELYSCHSRPERTEELPVRSRLRPLPPGRLSPPMILPWNKRLVPNRKLQGTQKQEVLVVSVSWSQLYHESVIQMKYEMFPMLTKKDSTLGLLLIYASKAMLCWFMFINNKPCLKEKKYVFNRDEFTNRF